MKKLFFARFVLLVLASATSVEAVRCWQCAAVDGRNCPKDAQLMNSLAHDACITWRIANGTVLLQNLVRFSEECSGSKVNFWSRFIDLYYQGTGGSVQCCTSDGCNTGISGSPDSDFGNGFGQAGLPPDLPGAPLGSFLTRPRPSQTQQQRPQALALQQSPQQSLAFNTVQANGQQHYVGTTSGGNTFPTANSNNNNNFGSYGVNSFANNNNLKLNGGSDLTLNGFPQLATSSSFSYQSEAQSSVLQSSQNGNCQQYFDKISAGEWLPRILVPLTFDRASETKVGVFYAKFKVHLLFNLF
jgi:hypothetical protein